MSEHRQVQKHAQGHKSVICVDIKHSCDLKGINNSYIDSKDKINHRHQLLIRNENNPKNKQNPHGKP